MHVLLRRTLGRCARGFTVVELMITVAVAAILLVIAVPSFNATINSHRLSTTANDLIAAINIARMEAVKLNATTQMCSNSTTSNTSDVLGTACTTESGAVYASVADSSAGTAYTKLQAPPAGLVSPVQLHGDITALRFNGLGLAYQPGGNAPYTGPVADLCNSQLGSNNHITIKITGGSIISTIPGTGTCP